MMNTNVNELKGKVSVQESNFSTCAGENLGYEKGAKMVKDYCDQNDDQISEHFIGRNMIEAMLAQPGVAGITMLSGLNKLGQPQPVLVGVDSEGNYLLNIITVNVNGKMNKQNGIVASGVISPGKDVPPPPDCGWL